MKHPRLVAASVVLVIGLGSLIAWQQEAWKKPPVVPHSLEGRSNCVMCHKPGAMEAAPDEPASHEGWPSTLCLDCHAKDAAVQTTAPPAIPHSLEGRSNCTMCHKVEGGMPNVPAMPADHEGRDAQYCQICHKPAA